MKKVLILASVASMIKQFNIPQIFLLKKLGYEVHVACNFEIGNTCDQNDIENLKNELMKQSVSFFKIDFYRSIIQFSKNVKAGKQVFWLLSSCQYEFIHCHSPIGGVVGRIVGHMTHSYKVYRDLVIELAESAKTEGAKQFIKLLIEDGTEGAEVL